MPTRGRSRPERGVDAPPASPRTFPRTRSGPNARGRSRVDARKRSAVLAEPRFAQTPDFTLGVEEELQLVDPETGSLVDRPLELSAAIADSDGRLQTEVFAATVETTTPVCADAPEMADELRGLRGRVVEAAADHGLAVAASGTHPFARWEAETHTESRRFDELIRELQLPMRSDLVFGQHVHVSVGSAEEAVQVTNDLRAYLPLVLALSANAPFWRGLDTGLQSARVNVSEGMPRSGPPPVFEDWTAFENHLASLRQAGAIEDVTELWWDARPRPDLGTVEVRIADQSTSAGTSAALAAFTHAIVVHLARSFRRGEAPGLTNPPAFDRENRWRALRRGPRARFVDVDEDGSASLRSVQATFDAAVDAMQRTIERLGVSDEVGHLRERLARGRGGADRQRAVYEAEADLAAVVRDLVERTRP